MHTVSCMAGCLPPGLRAIMQREHLAQMQYARKIVKNPKVFKWTWCVLGLSNLHCNFHWLHDELIVSIYIHHGSSHTRRSLLLTEESTGVTASRFSTNHPVSLGISTFFFNEIQHLQSSSSPFWLHHLHVIIFPYGCLIVIGIATALIMEPKDGLIDSLLRETVTFGSSWATSSLGGLLSVSHGFHWHLPIYNLLCGCGYLSAMQGYNFTIMLAQMGPKSICYTELWDVHFSGGLMYWSLHSCDSEVSIISQVSAIKCWFNWGSTV